MNLNNYNEKSSFFLVYQDVIGSRWSKEQGASPEAKEQEDTSTNIVRAFPLEKFKYLFVISF